MHTKLIISLKNERKSSRGFWTYCKYDKYDKDDDCARCDKCSKNALQFPFWSYGVKRCLNHLKSANPVAYQPGWPGDENAFWEINLVPDKRKFAFKNIRKIKK